MKNKKMKTKSLLFAITLTLFGCQEVQLTPSVDDELNQSQFISLIDLYSKTSAYSPDTPNQSGRLDVSTIQNSFGHRADEVYDELTRRIDNGIISSQEEIEGYVMENKKFLEIISDSDGDLSVELIFDHGYRYFMDQNRMINVGGIEYQVFENGLLNTSKYGENINDSKIWFDNVEDPSFYSRDVKIELVDSRIDEDDPNDECQKAKEGQRTNGSQRTKVFANVERNAGIQNQYAFTAIWKAKAYKKTFGIWSKVKRTLRGGYALGIDYQTNTGWESANDSYLVPKKKTKELKVAAIQKIITWTGSGKPGYHFYGVQI